MPYVFFKNYKNQDLWAKIFSNCSNFNILLWFLINLISDDAFLSAATANMCSMVHLVWLFMKTHLLALLQDNYLDLVRCAFLCKLSACVRNITVLSTPTEADYTDHFGRYRYVSNTQLWLRVTLSLPIHYKILNCWLYWITKHIIYVSFAQW